MKRILIIGATSAIAQAAARRWATEGHSFYLVGRDEQRLNMLAADLRVRGAAAVERGILDVCDFERHKPCIDSGLEFLGGLDLVLIAHGVLTDQKACEADFRITLKQLNTNAISVISLLTHIANFLEAQRKGTLVVISSVAGDRGRQSNYVYGCAKAAVTTFLQGLRQRLYPNGVKVVTIKPGFVDTPMTAQFEKGLLWSSPEKVAAVICRAAETGRDIAYAPGFWRAIMFIIRSIPETIFKRLRL